MKSELAYVIGDSLYLNVTNRCTAACTFCVRTKADGVDGHFLWLDSDPTAEDVLRDMDRVKGTPGGKEFKEYVFCGYGEPLMSLEVVVAVAKELKARGHSVRMNTNGHGSLINGRNVVPELVGLIDTVSISLNAQDPYTYDSLVRSKYGPDAYGAMVYFAEQCKLYLPRVILSVVDVPGVDTDACGRIAEEMGVEYRVRTLISEYDNPVFPAFS